MRFPRARRGPRAQRPGRTASPRPGTGPRAASGRTGRRSAGRCPVTGPDSAKSRHGGSSLSAPAAVALTGGGDHGCALHSPARSLAVRAPQCICQLRTRRLRGASSLPRCAAQSVASSGRRLTSRSGPRPPSDCPPSRLPPRHKSSPGLRLPRHYRRPDRSERMHRELHCFL